MQVVVETDWQDRPVGGRNEQVGGKGRKVSPLFEKGIDIEAKRQQSLCASQR